MKHGVSYLQEIVGRRLNPSKTITLSYQQEWVKNLFLGSVLFFLLLVLSVFIYLGMSGPRQLDKPGTQHIKANGTAYVSVIEQINKEAVII